MPVGLKKRVLDYIRKHRLMVAGNRVGLAVSGGLDSVALLRLLQEIAQDLGIVLSVVHFNHMIRGEASALDQEFVADLANRCGLMFFSSSGETPAYAQENNLSLEAAARQLRYGYFTSLIQTRKLDSIATAHTLDDQAETVLLRLLRGTGLRGLRGIYPKVQVSSIESESPQLAGFIVRPLLDIRRRELEDHLRRIGQNWCEDATNADIKYTRNRVRHVLLPMLETEFNPAIREGLSELAAIASEEDDYLESEARRLLPECGESLEIARLLSHPVSLQRRIIRRMAEARGMQLDFQEVERVRNFAAAGKLRHGPVDLTDGWCVRHGTRSLPSGSRTEYILFERKILQSEPAGDWEYLFRFPGQLFIPELDGAELRAEIRSQSISGGGDRRGEPLLDPAKLTPELTIRNWRPGDRFWPASSSSPKKVKELLQRKRISGMDRLKVPVVLSGNEIVWMPGFAPPRRLVSETSEGLQLHLIPPSKSLGN